MKDWYDASHGEFAQITAITAAASASNPPTGSLRRRSVRNRVSPGSGSGRMRRSSDTRCPPTDPVPAGAPADAPALAGQASGVRTAR